MHVIELLRSVQSLLRPASGCLDCYISEKDSVHKPIHYTEQWESESALETHLRSELYRRVLAALELSKREPEVHFYYTTETKGFELIEAVRGRARPPQQVFGD